MSVEHRLQVALFVEDLATDFVEGQEPQGGFGRISRDVPPTRTHQSPQGGLRL